MYFTYHYVFHCRVCFSCLLKHIPLWMHGYTHTMHCTWVRVCVVGWVAEPIHTHHRGCVWEFNLGRFIAEYKFQQLSSNSKTFNLSNKNILNAPEGFPIHLLKLKSSLSNEDAPPSNMNTICWHGRVQKQFWILLSLEIFLQSLFLCATHFKSGGSAGTTFQDI